MPALAKNLLFHHVAHLIRSPLPSIDSRFNDGNLAGPVVLEFLRCNTAVNATADSPRGGTLRETLQHWVLWNTFAEATAERHLAIERMSGSALLPLLREAKIARSLTAWQIDEALHRTPKTMNSGYTKKSALRWANLTAVDPDFALMAQMVALRHGYGLGESQLLPGLRSETGRCPQQHCGFNEQGKWACHLVWSRPRGRTEMHADVRRAEGKSS